MGNENYAVFWIKVASTLIDTVALLMVTVPLLTFIYGADCWAFDLKNLEEGNAICDGLLNHIFPAVASDCFLAL